MCFKDITQYIRETAGKTEAEVAPKVGIGERNTIYGFH